MQRHALQGFGGVVDRAGLQIVMLRGDGAGLHTPEGADRKARPRAIPAPSADFVKRMRMTRPQSVRRNTPVRPPSGGLPIKVGDDVVGAVGVSGSPGKDDDCSQASIDKVAAQLRVSQTASCDRGRRWSD